MSAGPPGRSLKDSSGVLGQYLICAGNVPFSADWWSQSYTVNAGFISSTADAAAAIRAVV